MSFCDFCGPSWFPYENRSLKSGSLCFQCTCNDALCFGLVLLFGFVSVAMFKKKKTFVWFGFALLRWLVSGHRWLARRKRRTSGP